MTETIRTQFSRRLGACLGIVVLLGVIQAAYGRRRHEPPIVHLTPDPKVNCEDSVQTKVKVNSKLTSMFFAQKRSSYPWYIIQHDDGHLENTFGEPLDAEDRKKIEHTANCVSTHQGSHHMDFCEAYFDGKDLRLEIGGGLSGYASLMVITIRGDDFRCAFEATYPAPGPALRWRITKKALHARTTRYKIGERFHGWLSVEFEEGFVTDEKLVWEPYKIEGYVKPVIQKGQ